MKLINAVLTVFGEIIVRKMKRLCRYIVVAFGFAILSPSISYAVDEQQCLGVFDPPKVVYPTLVSKAVEEYSFQYGNIVSVYSSMYSVMDKHCSEALGDELTAKKNVVVGHLLISFPSNKMMKTEVFRKCLLSHFHKKVGSYNRNLILVENTLDKLIPFFEKRFTQLKAAALTTNKNFTDYQICKGAFLMNSLVDGSPTELAEMIKRVEKESKLGMQNSNIIINNYCSKSQC